MTPQNKFEYSTVVFGTSKIFAAGQLDHERFHASLNQYGNEGWELVNTFCITRHDGVTAEIVAVFKRQR